MTTIAPVFNRTTLNPRRRAAWIALAGSALVILFWSLYFSGLLAPPEGHEVLSQYEAAFPLADAVLAGTLLVAGIGLLRAKRCGRFCLTAGASMALYLGVLDFTFYYRQGLYSPMQLDGAVELVVNLLCVVGGLVGLRFSWRLREERS